MGLNQKKVDEAEGGLAEVINTLKAGQKVIIVVYRGGEEVTLEVEIKGVEEIQE